MAVATRKMLRLMFFEPWIGLVVHLCRLDKGMVLVPRELLYQRGRCRMVWFGRRSACWPLVVGGHTQLNGDWPIGIAMGIEVGTFNSRTSRGIAGIWCHYDILHLLYKVLDAGLVPHSLSFIEFTYH